MIPLERLLALSLDELSGSELDEVELHVLSCSECARTLELLLRLESETRALLHSGQVFTFVGPGLQGKLAEHGLISRSYRLAPDQVVPCQAGRDDVYALTELEAPLAGVERADLLISSPLGELVYEDVPFDQRKGLIAYVSRSDVLRTLPSAAIKLRVVGHAGSDQRTIAEYVLDHQGYVP